MDSGSCPPIFEVKAGFKRQKCDLLLAVGHFLEAYSRLKKISFEIGFHTKIGSFLLIFIRKWIDLTLDKTSSFLSIIVDTSFLFKKPSAEVVVSSFVMSYEHFFSAHSADLSPFFSYSGVFKARSLSNLPLR